MRRLAVACASIALSTLVLFGCANPATAPSVLPGGEARFGDVPLFRADAGRTGVQPGPGPIGKPSAVWTRRLSAAIEAQPVLAGGVLYVGSADGEIHAIDAGTGTPAWDTPFTTAKAGITNALVADGGQLFAVDSERVLHAIDRGTGRQLWWAEGVDVVGLVIDGVVYVGAESRVVGYEAETGTEVWSWVAPDSVERLTIVDGVGFITAAGGTVHAVDLETRMERWDAVQTRGTQAAFPMISGDTLVAGTIQVPGPDVGEVFAVNFRTGQTRWRPFVPPSGTQVSIAAVRDGVLYAPTHEDGTFALSLANGSILWHNDTTGWAGMPAALAGKILYEPVDEPNAIVAIDIVDGHTLWEIPRDRPSSTWLIVSGGFIFATDLTGTITGYAEASHPLASATSHGESPESSASAPSERPEAFTLLESLEPSETGLDGVAGFDLAPDGTIFVIDTRPRVTALTSSGGVIAEWGERGDGDGEFELVWPDGSGGPAIAVGLDGLIYVSDVGNFRVQVFEPDGTFVRSFGQFGDARGQFIGPYQLAADEGGVAYVIDGPRRDVTRFDPDGTVPWRVGGSMEANSVGTLEHGAEWDSAGRLWFTDDARSRLLAIDRDGRLVDSFSAAGSQPGQMKRPCAVALDQVDRIYVWDCIQQDLEVFDAGHHYVGGWHPDGPPVLDGLIEIGGDGRLYGAGPDDTIVIAEIHLGDG
jgi:outer membrane protein assembly factor BamB